MSWMQKLYEAYEAAAAEGLVGKEVAKQATLLPVCHMEVNAPLELTITRDGDFVQATVVEDKVLQRTIIPCTESSASRTSGIVAMPLFDKLNYLAGDYAAYCPTSEKKKDSTAYFDAYLTSLRQWLPTAPPEVQAWGRYVEKRRMVGDLIACGVLSVDENGKVPAKWEGEGARPAIYKAAPNSPLEAFVRFRVQQPGDGEDRVWMMPQVRQAFIDYQSSLETKRDICYVRGVELPVSESSPKYVRYPGDGAKLVSANDSAGFTYRGRFRDASEALVLGRDTTEKAHSALRWLIQRQGYRNGEQVVLTFATGGKPLPSLGGDTCSLGVEEGSQGLWADLEGESTPEQPIARPREPYSTNQWMANRVNRALAGYQSDLKPSDEAIVIGLDSATPGRLSIFYYREMDKQQFFERICHWHSTCTWLHTYASVPDGTDEKGKPVYRRIRFVGAPAPVDIIKAAFGENVSDKLLKSGVERLLPCIADGARLPVDVVRSAARRATQRGNLGAWEADKALSIACALIRKFYNDKGNKEDWSMLLQPEVNERSYLFGRALAYAEQIERYALQLAGEKRTTNAERLMVAFAKHPAKTWMVLMERLLPYQQRLGQRSDRLEEAMEEVIARLQMEGYTNEPLNEKYLLGYACQKQAFARQRDENIEKKNAQAAEEE